MQAEAPVVPGGEAQRVFVESHLPLLLAGVIGGLIAFGLIGIFLGPVVLAVAYTLLLSWMAEVNLPDSEIAAPRR